MLSCYKDTQRLEYRAAVLTGVNKKQYCFTKAKQGRPSKAKFTGLKYSTSEACVESSASPKPANYASACWY